MLANSSSDSSTQSDDTIQPGDDKGTTTGSTLIQPTGTFVSAHYAVPANASLSSVCNTTSGASCKITFTNNAVTKSLDAQTTDRGGATYWNSWKPSDIGLTAGTWTVQAVASLNGQISTASDATPLEITQ